MKLLVAGTLAILAGSGGYYTSFQVMQFEPLMQVLAWVLLSLGLGVVLQPGLLRFAGPVLFYDLVRSARRSRQVMFRCAYACILLAMLFVTYNSFFAAQGGVFKSGALTLPAREMERLGNRFADTFMVVQFVAVVLLVPIYTAGAVTEEKERRTLEYLLATDLHDREIVLGKLAARLGHMVLLLLTGLPILSLVQFLGGVDPNRMLAGFAATALTLVSVSCLSVLVSVCNRTTWDAVFRTYLMLLVLYVGTYAASGLLPYQWGANFGNPVAAVKQIEGTWPGKPPAEAILGVALINYGLCHLLLAVVCAALAVGYLRRLALADAARGNVAASDKTLERDLSVFDGRPRQARPPVSDRAMLWKELYEKPARWRGTDPILEGCVVLVAWTAGPILLAVAVYATRLGEQANLLLRIVSTAWACFMLLLVALNAAGRFSREFEQQTMESLLTTPDRDGIPFAKWLASVLHVRSFWWILAWVWAMGLLSRGLDLRALPFLLISWWVYAAFLASLGLWFSVLTRSTTRATLFTPLAAGAVAGLGWLLLDLASVKLAPHLPRLARGIDLVQEYGLAPPVALWNLAFHAAETQVADPAATQPLAPKLAAALVGLVFYALLAWIMWKMAWLRFRALTAESERFELETDSEEELATDPDKREDFAVFVSAEEAAKGPSP